MTDIQLWMFWVTLAGLGLAVLVQGTVVAFTFGRLFERQRNDGVRIKKLEDAANSDERTAGAFAVSLAELKITLGHMADDVGSIKQNMNWMGRIANAEGHAKG